MSPHLSEQMFGVQAYPHPNPPPQGEGGATRYSALLAQLEVLEAFGHGEILAGRHLGGPLANRLLELSPIADLTLVFLQRLDLQLDRVADIDPGIRLVRSRQVDLFHLVRLQALVEQLRKHESRIRSGDDRVQG